jgi:hypothetical protein
MWLIRDTFNGERCQVMTQVADRVYILNEGGIRLHYGKHEYRAWRMSLSLHVNGL